MVSTFARTPRTGSRFGSSPLPATFITTPNSLCVSSEAVSEGFMHEPSAALSQVRFSHSSILRRPSVSGRRFASMKSKYRLGRNGGSGRFEPARGPCEPEDEPAAAGHWPGRMSFDFSAARAGGDGGARRPDRRRSCRPTRASRSRLGSRQRPAFPSAVVTRGPYSFEILFQDTGVEHQLVRAFGIDAGLDQTKIDQPQEHSRGRFLIPATSIEDNGEYGNPHLGRVEDHLDLETDHLPRERVGRTLLW